MEDWSGEPRREDGPDPGEAAPEGAGSRDDAEAAEGAAPLMEPELVSGSTPPAPEPYRPMARRRLALTAAAAVVLGVLAGAAAGYEVQQERRPTPLPKLVGPPPTQPAAPGPVPSSAKPADDRNAVYEGDLLALLVPAPKGATAKDRGWKTLSELAGEYVDPVFMYDEFADRGFRRSVVATWETGKGRKLVTTEVALTQFRDEERQYTSQWLHGNEVADGGHQSYGEPLPGHTDSVVMPSSLPYEEEGGLRVYVGEAFARVGNIGVEVYVTAMRPVTAKALTSVITKQLERL
jgi:hypothetical protein